MAINMQRLEASFENQSLKFYRQSQEFQRQFFHIYECRLHQLDLLLREKVHKKYGKLFHFLHIYIP